MYVQFCVNLGEDTFLGWLVVHNMEPEQNLGWDERPGTKDDSVVLSLLVTLGRPKCPFLEEPPSEGQHE